MEPTVWFELANAGLLVFLLYTYVQNYREIKSGFGLGLVFFALFLLLQNLLAAYFHFIMVDYYSAEVMQHALVLSGVQTLALAVLAYITWKG